MTRALRLAMAALLLAALWGMADGPGALARIMVADAWWLVAALMALHAQTVLSGLRWRITANGLGLGLTTGRAVREYYVAQLVNQTLPGGVLGDAARAARSREGAGLGPAAAAVAIERMAGQVAMAAALGVGLCMSYVRPGGLIWPPGLRPVVLAVLAVIVVALFVAAQMQARWMDATRAALQRGLTARGALRGHLILGAAILALNLTAFACAAQATGTGLSPLAVLALVPLILTAMVIPLTVGGWGWREGAAAALFPVAGADPAAGLAASATFGVLMLVSALPGLLWLTPAHSAAPDLPADLPRADPHLPYPTKPRISR
jgi:glycosyltransferase 2 family protein